MAGSSPATTPGGHAAPPPRLLPGNRLHLQQGPIDLVIGADGAKGEVARAYRQAATRFDGLLAALVAELPALRRPLGETPAGLRDPVARRMAEACRPHRALWVTPMAAVAGAVAEAVLAALTCGCALSRAYVNNGGDIALYLAPGAELSLGVVAALERGVPEAFTRIAAASPVRGVATSGLGGRSLTRGIAQSVTVLARRAADADVAATLIANAVDVEHPAIERQPARALDPDSDLGELPVTVAVGALPPAAVERALAAGAALAEELRAAGHIEAALLSLQGRHRAVPLHPNPAGSLVAWS